MTGNYSRNDDDLVGQTVDTLRPFGLTEYEAKCFVALSRIGAGTAKEISEVSEVPRARVYDCMDSLAEQGLVDIQNASPRRFRAASTDEVVRVLDRRCTRRIERLEKHLERLERPSKANDDGDIWVTEGDEEVAERIEVLIREAEEELLLAVAVDGLLTEEVREALIEAEKRGVSITAGSPSEKIRAELRTLLSKGTVLETWTWWESHPIQPGGISAIVMPDGRSLLVSADIETSLPGVRKHRALWTDNKSAPLVGMMRPLLRNAITSETDPGVPA